MRSVMHKLLCLCLVLCLLTGCTGAGDVPGNTGGDQPGEFVDYAGQLELNMNSDTVKAEATVEAYIDGDTVHFNVSTDVMSSGLLKARFLAIDTPESTGKIEEYGKAASNYTKETLKKAESIILESDTDTWNADSTGGRYLVWVWYKTADMTQYRNLNIEILQKGLAIASNAGGNIYGSYAMSAISQAKAHKLNVHSGQKDPDFYYGPAVELDLKELRTNIESYSNMTVAFNGIVTMNNNNGVFVEAYDSETDVYYGIYVYYGFALNGDGMAILKVGNEVRIVGKVQYYENGGSWQVAGLKYRSAKPNDPENIQKLSEGNSAAYVLTDPDRFVNGMVEVISGEEVTSRRYAELVLGTSIQMKNLRVVDVYTTVDEESSSMGAMTLTCEANGVTVSVRTIVLYDENGALVTEDAFIGKTIDVKGIVDCFQGTYQIKVFSVKDVTIH